MQLSRHREEQLTARNLVPLVVAHEEDLVPVSGDAVAEPYLHHRSNTTVRTSKERLQDSERQDTAPVMLPGPPPLRCEGHLNVIRPSVKTRAPQLVGAAWAGLIPPSLSRPRGDLTHRWLHTGILRCR